MSKLTRGEVFQRFEAALAILGEEDCEDAQADLRMKNLRNLVKWASQALGELRHEVFDADNGHIGEVRQHGLRDVSDFLVSLAIKLVLAKVEPGRGDSLQALRMR